MINRPRCLRSVERIVSVVGNDGHFGSAGYYRSIIESCGLRSARADRSACQGDYSCGREGAQNLSLEFHLVRRRASEVASESAA